MLTIKKLNNLYMYFFLFAADASNTDNHISYIEEKYNLFFNSNPDIKILKVDKSDYLIRYVNRWKMDFDEFTKSDSYPIWLFTKYLSQSNKETTFLKEKYRGDPSKYGDLSIRRVLMIYKKFFKSYGSISEDDLEKTLHANLMDYYSQEVSKCQSSFRNVFINQIIEENM